MGDVLADVELFRVLLAAVAVAEIDDDRGLEASLRHARGGVFNRGGIVVRLFAAAQNYVAVRIAGSGDVQYKGNPKKLNQKVAGSGELRKI